MKKNYTISIRIRVSVIVSLVIFLNSLEPVFGQSGVKIAATPGTADPSAMLDITSSNKGLLLPRVALVSLTDNVNPINNPATGLVIYNLGTGGVAATGIYFWSGSAWVQLTSGGLSGSGTANQVTKFTGANSIGNSTISDDGTNVAVTSLGGSGLRPVYADASGTLKGTYGVSATGGTITNVGGYRVHTFLSSGTFTVTTGGNVEVLMVGGGGSGGGRHGGGGGGGGVLYMPSVAVTSATAYPIVVGLGAPTNTGCTNVPGTNGGNTTAFSETALGGGGGGAYCVGAGLAGGSGGGTGHSGCGTNMGGASTQSNPTSHIGTGYGNTGGNNSGGGNEAAGGGGAGGPGQMPVSEQWAGAGGPGVLINVDGYDRYWGGGGGGGGWGNNGGAGGIGGGGGGCAASGNFGGQGGKSAINNGQAGATVPSGGSADGGAGGANTGGGGGGSGQCANSPWVTGNGGAGGSGIVIIRYLN